MRWQTNDIVNTEQASKNYFTYNKLNQNMTI